MGDQRTGNMPQESRNGKIERRKRLSKIEKGHLHNKEKKFPSGMPMKERTEELEAAIVILKKGDKPTENQLNLITNRSAYVETMDENNCSNQADLERERFTITQLLRKYNQR